MIHKFSVISTCMTHMLPFRMPNSAPNMYQCNMHNIIYIYIYTMELTVK